MFEQMQSQKERIVPTISFLGTFFRHLCLRTPTMSTEAGTDLFVLFRAAHGAKSRMPQNDGEIVLQVPVSSWGSRGMGTFIRAQEP